MEDNLTFYARRVKVRSMTKETNRALILDEAKLLQLTPPLSVYVTKIYFAGRTTPISLPSAKMSNEFGPGQGYEHADVKAISALLAKIGGGGKYRVQVTDVQGAKVEFDIWLDPASIPDLMPPDLAAASPSRQVQQAPVIPMPLPQMQQFQQPMQAVSGVGPNDWITQVPAGVPRVAPQQSQPQPVYYTPSAPPSSPHWTPQSWQPSALTWDRDRERYQEEKRAHEETRVLREELLKRDALHEREKVETAHRGELVALREELRRLAEKPREDGQLELLREQIRQTREELLHGNKNESSNTLMAIMQMMQSQQANFQQMLPLLMKRDDGGQMTLIMESFRQQAESTREMFRAITDQMRERERMNMTPKDTLDMAEKLRATSGADVLLKSVTDGYNGVLTMMKGVAEMYQQYNGKEEGPVAGIIREGLAKAGEVAQQFVTAKRDVAVSEAKAREIEAASQIAQTRGLSGAPVVQAQNLGYAPPPPVVQGVSKSGSPSEEDIRRFGPVIESIQRLRLGVKEGKLTPGQAFQAVKQGFALVKEKGWKIPALVLLEEGQVNEFVQILVPDADRKWQVELGRWFYKNGDPGPDPSEEEDDGDEDGEE